MKVRNVSGEDRYLPDVGEVAAGASTDVDDRLGAALLDQPANWASTDVDAVGVDVSEMSEED